MNNSCAKPLAALVALALGAATVSANAAPPPSAPDRPLLPGFSVIPSTLPKSKPAPVRMQVRGRHRNEEGAPLGALRTLRFEGDRHLALDLKGVPVCERGRLDVRRGLDEMEKLCGDAAVGHGWLTVEAFFPGERWIPATGDMTIYNLGRKPDGPDLLAFAELPAPITATPAIPIELRRLNRGPFGWEARAKIPKIAGGYGWISDYSLGIGKRVLSATCVGGKLQLRVVAGFDDGTRRSERAVRPCTVSKADVRQ